MNAMTRTAPVLYGRIRKPISIQKLLEWAFADECASIDFEDPGTLSGNLPSFGMEYILMERQRLGCQVDGGGRSDPHPDADLVASAVAVLPVERGGRQMAVQIAELARARAVPDAMIGQKPKCEPLDWVCNRPGGRAKTETIGQASDLRKGRKVDVPVRVCPVTYKPTAAKIAAARRNY
ncbi:MAG: hypothetical protein AAF965_09400, partial [Pseudomonadota bacterium]